MTNLTELPAFDADGLLTVVIESPRGCQNKYAYDPRIETFRLRRVLPEGMFFPFEFGFVPSTAAEDGDPLDALVLMDYPSVTGCVLSTRLIGAIRAVQRTGDRPWVRNDRLICVAEPCRSLGHVSSLGDLRPHLLDEIEAFLIAYNAVDRRTFKPEMRLDAESSRALIETQT